MALIKAEPTRSNGEFIEGVSFFKWMHNRTIKKNKNVMIGVIGNVGSGKSYYCLRIKEVFSKMLKRKFNIDHVCFSIYDLMELINKDNLKRGDVVILEEAGVNAGNRDWQSLVNKTFNYLLQTFRNLNLVLLVNLPDIRMLDINTRRLLHGTIEMKAINYENNTSIAAFKFRQHIHHFHKDLWKFLKVKRGNKLVKLSRITLKKPSEEICDIYEEKRKQFTDNLNKEIEEKLSDFKQRASGKKPLTEIQLRAFELDQEGLSAPEIALELNKSERYIYRLLEACEKKGHITSKHKIMPKIKDFG